MIIHLDELADGHVLEADICVIGAGAAGLTLAAGLADSRASVLLVESGLAGRDEASDELNAGEVGGERFYGLAGRARGLGGTTQIWPGQSLKLDPFDLEQHDWIPGSGWPIAWAELDRHYGPALALLGLPPHAFELDLRARFGVAIPPVDASKLLATFSVFSPRPNLAQVMLPRLRAAERTQVVLGATAVRLGTNESQSVVEHVELRSLAGRSALAKARFVVLAGGGIENPRLLLTSGNRERGGLANEHDVVGRFFHDHIAARAGIVQTERPAAIQALFNVFYRRGAKYHTKLVTAPALQTAQQVAGCSVNFAYEFSPDTPIQAMMRFGRAARSRRLPERAGHDALLAARGLHRVAAAGIRRYARGWSPAETPSSIGIMLIAEQAPNRDSRVTLSDRLDSFGTPQARVEWQLGEIDRRTVEVCARALAGELARLGLGALELAPWIDGAGWEENLFDTFHHMGATRMATDPRHGVVDTDGRVHGLANLYVAGSSVFPTSGYANPTLTVMALAVRLAERLKLVAAP